MSRPAHRHRPLQRTGWLFLGLGAVELIAGLVYNPALLLIAIHDLAGDGLPFVLYDPTNERLERSPRHLYYCLMRKLLNALVPATAIDWPAAALFLERADDTSLTACWVTVAVTLMNFTCNRVGHKWPHDSGEDHHHSLKLDLLADMLCAPLAAAASILAYAFMASVWNKAASWAIVLIVCLMMARAEIQALWLLKIINSTTTGGHLAPQPPPSSSRLLPPG